MRYDFRLNFDNWCFGRISTLPIFKNRCLLLFAKLWTLWPKSLVKKKKKLSTKGENLLDDNAEDGQQNRSDTSVSKKKIIQLDENYYLNSKPNNVLTTLCEGVSSIFSFSWSRCSTVRQYLRTCGWRPIPTGFCRFCPWVATIFGSVNGNEIGE